MLKIYIEGNSHVFLSNTSPKNRKHKIEWSWAKIYTEKDNQKGNKKTIKIRKDWIEYDRRTATYLNSE